MQLRIFVPMTLVLGGLMWVCARDTGPGNHTTRAVASSDSRTCIQCHSNAHFNLVAAWEKGRHAEAGIGCFECHQALAGEPDAIPDHYGFVISSLVTPKDCGRCHQKETASFLGSHHSKAGRVLHTSETFLGEVVEGAAASINGCQSCHGSKIEISAETRRPLARSYPNSGIGRMNPDGTEGNCAACHQRHDFRMDTVRKAETCGRCHHGPDHPQLEVWSESKHGHAFAESNTGVDLNGRSLVLGKEAQTVPSCVTCHLGGTIASEARSTHDPGERLSWNIRAPVSDRREKWREKKSVMMTVCRQCHGPNYPRRQYERFEKAIALYNHRFAIPARSIMDALYAAGKLDKNPFNEKIELAWYLLWHHEGRRARNGAAMMGADHVQWKGFYEVALRFYFEIVPEAERLLPGVTSEIMARPEHAWFKETDHTPEGVLEAIEAGKLFWEKQKPEPSAH